MGQQMGTKCVALNLCATRCGVPAGSCGPCDAVDLAEYDPYDAACREKMYSGGSYDGQVDVLESNGASVGETLPAFVTAFSILPPKGVGDETEKPATPWQKKGNLDVQLPRRTPLSRPPIAPAGIGTIAGAPTQESATPMRMATPWIVGNTAVLPREADFREMETGARGRGGLEEADKCTSLQPRILSRVDKLDPKSPSNAYRDMRG